jgi:hypothetical protein
MDGGLASNRQARKQASQQAVETIKQNAFLKQSHNLMDHFTYITSLSLRFFDVRREFGVGINFGYLRVQAWPWRIRLPPAETRRLAYL